jgi:alpha-tubulin suppressor-like RCC1 family protein
MCGGETNQGRLGNNTESVDLSSPVQIGALTTWLSAATSYNNSIAVKTDNTLWTWGFNSDGQLGQNNRVSRSSPVQIGALTDWSPSRRGFCF